MVYNNMAYSPASLTEKLQERFSGRVKTAVFRAVPGGYKAEPVKEQSTGSEMVSFFGRLDDTRTAQRAIPKREAVSRETAVRRSGAEMRRPAAPVTQTFARVTPSMVRNDRRLRETANMQTKEIDARRVRAMAAQKRRSAATKVEKAYHAPAPAPEIAAAFSKAFFAGSRIKRVAESGSVPRRIYAPGAVPSGALRRGRSNVPGSRHAILVTVDQKAERGSLLSRIKESLADRHVAEHRVGKTPFPLGFVTLVCICAFAVMTMLFSFSQIHEYNSEINALKATYNEVEERAAKLEVQIEERDDIRNIEKIAVEEMGMVSVDMAESKFVSVSVPDRVEVIEVEEPETESGVSQLLSIIAERFDGIGEYFN